MATSDTSEKGLESLIVRALTGFPPRDFTRPESREESPYGGTGYVAGDPLDYDRDYAVDFTKLLSFLKATQPKVVEQLELADDGPPRLKFLARLQGEIAKRGIVDVLRKGIHHGPAAVDLFYGSPSPANTKASE